MESNRTIPSPIPRRPHHPRLRNNLPITGPKGIRTLGRKIQNLNRKTCRRCRTCGDRWRICSRVNNYNILILISPPWPEISPCPGQTRTPMTRSRRDAYRMQSPLGHGNRVLSPIPIRPAPARQSSPAIRVKHPRTSPASRPSGGHTPGDIRRIPHSLTTV